MRCAGTPTSLARRYCERPIGRRNSSRSSSPGVTGLSFCMVILLVIVHDLDVFGTGCRPAEADAVLVVDADAVLAGAGALERLEPVAGRDAQVVEASGDLQLAQPAARDRLEVHEASDPPTTGQRLRIRVLERDDHEAVSYTHLRAHETRHDLVCRLLLE